MGETPFGICICGLNGSGKTTIGRELAEKLGYYPMDIENYYFDRNDLTYANPRPREEVRAMLLADIKKNPRFVLSAVSGKLGGEIESRYQLVIYFTAPWETRMSRIQRRTRARLGQRAEEGGDLYAQEQAFLRFAAARDPIHIEQWLKGIPCRVLRLDGTLPIDSLVAMICDEIKQQTV